MHAGDTSLPKSLRTPSVQRDKLAKRETDIQQQDALQKIGSRTAEKEKAVGISNELAQQSIKEEAKVTMEKELAITKLKDVTKGGTAKIDWNVVPLLTVLKSPPAAEAT